METSRWSAPTKVCQFELSSLVDQQVLGFQVSVENFPPMTVRQTSQQLEKKELRREKTSGVTGEMSLEKLDKHGCKTGDEDTEERSVTTNTGNTGCSVVVQFQIKVNRTFFPLESSSQAETPAKLLACVQSIRRDVAGSEYRFLYDSMIITFYFLSGR